MCKEYKEMISLGLAMLATTRCDEEGSMHSKTNKVVERNETHNLAGQKKVEERGKMITKVNDQFHFYHEIPIWK